MRGTAPFQSNGCPLPPHQKSADEGSTPVSHVVRHHGRRASASSSIWWLLPGSTIAWSVALLLVVPLVALPLVAAGFLAARIISSRTAGLLALAAGFFPAAARARGDGGNAGMTSRAVRAWCAPRLSDQKSRSSLHTSQDDTPERSRSRLSRAAPLRNGSDGT